MPKKEKVSVNVEKGKVGGTTTVVPRNLLDGTVFRSDKNKIATYRKMKSHYQLSACLNVINFTLQKIDWYVEKEDSTDKAKEVVEKSIEKVWHQLIRSMCKALWAGYSPMTKVFEMEDGYITLKKIRDLAPETCRPKIDDVGNFAGFYQDQDFIPTKYAFWYPYQMEDGDLYGNPMLKGAYNSWYFSELTHLFANRYYERFGEPVVKGKAPNETVEDNTGAKKDAINTVQSLGESLKSHSVITLPSDTDERGNPLYDISYLESQMRGVDFDTYLKRLDTEMSRAVFIPDLIFGSGRTGSYALGKEQRDTLITGLMGIVDDMFSYIRKYIVKQIVELNFGDIKSPKLTYTPISKVNEDAYARMVEILISKDRAKPDLKMLSEKIGLPIEELKQQDISKDTDVKKDTKVKVVQQPQVQPTKMELPDEPTAQKQLGRIERYLKGVFEASQDEKVILEAIENMKIGYPECMDKVAYVALEEKTKESAKQFYQNGLNLEEIVIELSKVFGLDKTKELKELSQLRDEVLKNQSEQNKIIVSLLEKIEKKDNTVHLDKEIPSKITAEVPPIIIKDKKETPFKTEVIESGGKTIGYSYHFKDRVETYKKKKQGNKTIWEKDDS